MIEFYITEQSIRFASPVIAANSLNFLEAKFRFNGSSWDGSSKWAHFRQAETVYDFNLDGNDMISSAMGLDLSIGEWEVYVTGVRGETRLTTVPVILTVTESGLIEEPLHKIPMSVAEQVDSKATLAMQKAAKLEQDAADGKFNGSSFKILAYYASVQELEESVQEVCGGDMYGIGSEPPYRLYVYDGAAKAWVDNGDILGLKGDRGDNGYTFIPQVAENGNLSWTNNGGLENPETVNIMGTQGPKGDTGADGKSPYELAVEEGFQGTQETFNWALKNIASHASGHEENGADPINVTTAMIADENITTAKIKKGAVTGECIGQNAVSSIYTAVIGTEWEGSAAPYTQVIQLEGMSESDSPIADALISEDNAEAGDQLDAWAEIYRISAGDGSITVYAANKTDTDITVRLLCIRK